MTDWLRRAGRGRLPDGSTVTWTIAEGARGRRWRWTVADADANALRASALVELDPDDRFARLELATPGGLVTFHPDTDRLAAHGNVVAADGVRPIAARWRPEWGIGFEDDPFGSAVGGWRGAGLVAGPGTRWRIDETELAALPRDGRGIPALAAAEEWPLEE